MDPQHAAFGGIDPVVAYDPSPPAPDWAAPPSGSNRNALSMEAALAGFNGLGYDQASIYAPAGGNGCVLSTCPISRYVVCV